MEPGIPDAPRVGPALQKHLGSWASAFWPGLALAIAAGYADYTRFWQAFYVGSMFALTMALGALIFVLVQHRVRSPWAIAARRIMEWQSRAITSHLLFVWVPVFMKLGKHPLYPVRDPLVARAASTTLEPR